MQNLERGWVGSGWMSYTVPAMKTRWRNVPLTAGESTIAGILKMPGSTALTVNRISL